MATKTWAGGATGNWNVSGNWSPSGVPVTGDDVVINTSGCDVTLDVHIGGGQTNTGLASLTITLGTLDTNDGSNRMLTVTGNTSIGPGSGSADQATLTCNGSDISLGSGHTSSFALVVNQGGTFDGGSGNHTIGSIEVKNNSNAKMDFTSGNTTVDSEKTSENRNIITNVNSTVTHSNGTIIMTFAGNTEISWESTTSGNEGPYNFTVNHASAIQRSRRSPFRVLNNLTISAGEYNTLSGDSGADLDLTVAGVVDNDGTLTFNSSTVNLGSTSSQAGDFQGGGTFNLDTSTINFHTAGSANFNPSTSANFDTNTSTLNLIGLDSSTRQHNFTFASGNLHNITTSRGTGSGTHTDKINGTTTITGDLTVGANSKFSSGTRVFTVNGDVSVTGELDCDDSDKPMTFGSLTIGSTGTYNATSGTTTILGSSGGFALLDEGTFTHNSGTVKIDFETSNLNSSTRIHQNGAKKLNNVEIEMNRTTDEVTWSVASGTSQGIAGNLTLTKGESYLYSLAHDFDVDGHFLVDANGTWGSLGHSGAHEAATLTVNSGGTFIATSGTTTITTSSGAPVNGRCWYIPNSATFTHNKGLCKFTSSSPQVEMVSSGGTSTPNPFYDVEQTSGTMQWKGEHTKVLNNATLRGSQFNGSTGNLTVLGICRFTASTFNGSDTSTSNNSFFQTLIIESGATVDVSALDITVGSLRNLGGTIQ